VAPRIGDFLAPGLFSNHGAPHFRQPVASSQLSRIGMPRLEAARSTSWAQACFTGTAIVLYFVSRAATTAPWAQGRIHNYDLRGR
jgi:hypothetical protein